jgi:SAM-dependent methyltransferase
MAGPQRRRRSPLSLVQQEADVRFYLHRLREVPQGAVLVLGAANGRVAWELARHASRVIAVEPSETMLAAAEAQRAAQPAEASAHLRFHRSDLRSLRLGERFSLVAAPQNALGLLTSRADLEAVVATVRLHLEEEGVFAFDVLNAPPRLVDGDAFMPPRLFFTPHLRESRRSAGRAPLAVRRWRPRLFSPRELDQVFRDGGLIPVERYGSFDGKAFEPTDAYQVVVAEGIRTDIPGARSTP